MIPGFEMNYFFFNLSLKNTQVWLNLVSIASGNGLSSVWRQAITRSNADLLPIAPLGTNFRDILIKVE